MVLVVPVPVRVEGAEDESPATTQPPTQQGPGLWFSPRFLHASGRKKIQCCHCLCALVRMLVRRVTYVLL